MKKVLLMAALLLSLQQAIAQRAGTWATKQAIGNVGNLYKVSDSVYRAAQPDSSGFAALKAYGIASILNLRSHHSDAKASGHTGLQLYLVEMEAKQFDDNAVIAALKILQTSPKPVLIHCQHGSDRTGVITAMYRIVIQGWSKEAAIREMEQGGFGFHSQYLNIPTYIRNVDVQKIQKAIL
ncbi:dual specificity protein phosphatase family protein [Chitinophaga sp. Cy-1792]|uniref:dual specificity protein phosphatase family protein n=1 Tax=Chitinophaga sp. Cy-1792 TaxID=2608339 RepID=UPI001421DC1B|nr:dual specificity protein phosphatase family protein [Chitinophaga sp. Cy-1792]NIG54992.1 protein tyrosine phosphatase [Chitinophaga sp. Cy-1792]